MDGPRSRHGRWAAGGLLVGLLAGALSTSFGTRAEAGEPLYFALEVKQGGRLVARPQLLAESGKEVEAVLVRRDGSPRLGLSLRPTYADGRCGVDMTVDLPDAASFRRSFELANGEELSHWLDADTEVRVLMMKVRSPEFGAYMASPPADGAPPSLSIPPAP